MKKFRVEISVLIMLLSSRAIAADLNAEDVLNLNVNSDGIYQVSHQELVAFGLNIAGEPINRLALMNLGEPVQIEVQGSTADPSKFGPGAYIRFVGKGLDTLYTDTNVYTLRLDSDAHRAIEAESIPIPRRAAYASSYLATRKYAPQNAYSFASPDRKDAWYADRVLALNKPAQQDFFIELDEYVPGGNTGGTRAKLKTKLWGGTDLSGPSDDHHVRFKFNGQQVIDETFDGFSKKEISAVLTNPREGSNNIRMEMPLDQGFAYEAVNVDSIEVSYPRGFVAENDALSFLSTFNKFLVRGFSSSNIQVYRESVAGQLSTLTSTRPTGQCNATQPRCRVSFGGTGKLSTYHVFSDTSIKTPIMSFLPINEDIRSGNAEYLIITHPDFIAEANETDHLGRLVDSLKEQFTSVDVVDVEHIYAQFGHHIFDPEAIRDYIKYAHDERGLQMVLLVGGDIYDYRGFENRGARSFIPSIYVPTDSLINFAPVDAKYVDFNNQQVPQLPIGRLPVRSMQELGVLMDKRSAYMDRSYTKRALFAADGVDELRQYSFKLDGEMVKEDFFQGWDVETAYVDDLGVSAARAKIIEQINAGTSLTSFFGHSSTNQWTFDGMFNGFDAANLANENRPTIVTQWGCWNTYYVNPNEDSMGHRFMMEGNRGAVAVMGATTLTTASHERLLARLVFDRLTKGESLGLAITNAKKEFAQSRPDALDVILGWTLLGFPELVL